MGRKPGFFHRNRARGFSPPWPWRFCHASQGGLAEVRGRFLRSTSVVQHPLNSSLDIPATLLAAVIHLGE